MVRALSHWRVLMWLSLGALSQLASAAPQPAAGSVELAWRQGGTLHYSAVDRTGRHLAQHMPAEVSLGSLWKLFVYAYLGATRQEAPPYQCRGQDRDEVYCCAAGESIARDAALVKSCGLFFSPTRLGIDAQAWHAFWSQQRTAPAWLTDLTQLRPDTRVSLNTLFDALDAVPPAARREASSVLLARVLDAQQPGHAVRYLGSRLRVKSYSWHPDDAPDERIGGGAGWLADGRPVWFRGQGTSQQVLARDAARLGLLLPPTRSGTTPGCVVVDYFERYPLRDVLGADGTAAAPGPLRGRHVARFRNGVSLPFLSDGELGLQTDAQGPRVFGRMAVDDYVARVIDREGDAHQTEAARALAVVARSYLLAQAQSAGNCLRIEDSSRTQRVSPNPPSAAARAAATFTAELVLKNTPVGHRIDDPAPGRLAWTDAVARSEQGQAWDQILAASFPAGDLVAMADPGGQTCQPLPLAQTWLSRQIQRWRPQLDRVAGFEAPPETPQVCRLSQGNPYSEPDRNRIHVRGLNTSEDRIALAHEYMHLALQHHPSGEDETLVESWARRLALGVAP